MKKLINQLDLSIDFSPMSADALALQLCSVAPVFCRYN